MNHLSEFELMEIAGRMEDHKVGTFEVCLEALKKCNGSERDAREMVLTARLED